MAKARASGSDAVHLLAKETVYGTAISGAGGGVYRRMPLRSYSLGAEQPLEDDPVWNRSRPEDSDPAQGNLTVTGDIVLPMDARGVGVALLMALGPAVSVETGVDTDVFEHTFLSGKDLLSFTHQIGHPKLTSAKWRTHLGVKAGGLQFPMQRNGRALMTIPLIGQAEVKDVSGARDASPLIYDYLPFNNATGSVKVGGVAVANITGGQFNFSNGLEPVEPIRADMMIDGVDDGLRTLGGSFDLRFGANSTLDDLADDNEPAEVELAFAIPSQPDWGLTFTMPRVFFPKTKKPVQGPGGISVTANWRAAFDQTAGHMLEVVLVNDVTAYI
jgi:hypothetical protein